MKQQMLEAEVKELKAQLYVERQHIVHAYEDKLRLEGIIERQAAQMTRMQNELDSLKAPTVGRGPQGASLDREMRNGKPNGFTRPQSYWADKSEPDGAPYMGLVA